MIRVDPNTYGSTPGASSSSRPGYYLGVAHYWQQVKGSKDGRSYKHLFIKMEAEPPFKVLQVLLWPVQIRPGFRHLADSTKHGCSGWCCLWVLGCPLLQHAVNMTQPV